ncbi:MAG: hypothetical protein Q7R83_03005, partial [bacterium]|nr:hypothetical protein [bacterium]
MISRSFKFFSAVLIGLVLIATVVTPLVPTAFAEVPPELPTAGAGGGLPVMIGGDATKVSGTAYKNILTEIVRTLTTALFNAAQQFLGQLAYDAANYIAAGGKGQSAQFYKKGFGEYLQNAGQDAAGEFIGSLNDLQIGGTKFFDSLGFDLCKPSDPRKLLKTQLSLGAIFPGGPESKYTRPKPKCDFQQIMDNYDQLGETMSNTEVLDAIGFKFNTNTSDIGVSTAIGNLFSAEVSKKLDFAKLARTEGGGFKAVSGVISGNVKTPSKVVEEATKEATVTGPKNQQNMMTGTFLQSAFNKGPIEIVKATASIFLNTLASKFLKRVMSEGLDAFSWGDTLPKKVISGPDSVVTAGANDVRDANIDLKQVGLQKSGEYDVLPELALCPPEGTPRGALNCTVDQELISAIQNQDENGGITIRKALDRGLLHKNYKLIPSDPNHAKENQDKNCYMRAYCASNLKKLRLNRILPVGFEFAANSEENKRLCGASVDRCVDLEKVVSNFSNCNEQGEWDIEHPWCHLIDPNWIITSPPQQCNIMGYGDDLLTEQLDQRRQECRDIQTCLSRNNDRECVGGYGYCVAERTVYRFTAEECPQQMASCRNYASRAGDSVSFLRNTIDYGNCSTENIGCLAYATKRMADGSSWDAGVSTGSHMYFDKTLATCDKQNDGCTKLFQAQAAVPALNLMANGSFERTTGTNAVLTEWSGQMEVAKPVGGAVEGFNTAVIPNDQVVYHQVVELVPTRTYTFSLYAKATQAGTKLAASILQYKDTSLTGDALPQGEVFFSDGCVKTADGLEIQSAASSTWSRYICTFIANVAAHAADIRLSAKNLQGDGLFYDAVQLEEGEYETDFVDGYNPSMTAVHLKVAPDELVCTGKTPPELCKSFSQSCRQQDAGCQGYTDLAGGTEIPAIISPNDLCPSDCIGYAEYRKGPSSFDLIHDVTDQDFDDPSDSGIAYFIPTRASICKQAEVGCEEFTNVGAEGGEQTAAFRQLRLCEKPNENSQTYFTWEGSDTTGYQLHTWSLMKAGKRMGDAVSGGPVVIKLRDLDGRFKDPLTCNDDSWRAGLDGDCRQFYDAEGNTFYRYYSQTILSTEQCLPYRLDRTNSYDCTNTGGDYKPATGECIYQVYAPESMRCSAAAAGCRAYAGVSAGNIAPVLKETFQDGKGRFTYGEKSSESLLVGANSLRVVTSVDHPDRSTSVVVPTEVGAIYQVSFWAKGVGIGLNGNNGQAVIS